MDGRVLVAGGYFNRYPISLAELFDPRTDTFISTGSMSTPRGFSTATRLADGRVLVTGGDQGPWNFDGPYLASTEIYDPSGGAFSLAGSMASGRNLQTATLLQDGRVLIIGGNDRGQHSLSSAELYDPATGAFSLTGSMSVGRAFHTATLLDDGRVLVVGGTSDGWVGAQFLASAEIYDPASGVFSSAGSMAGPRGSHTATLLRDGRVLVVGGTPDGASSLTTAELFDPRTATFLATGPMEHPRAYQAATVLPDGRVLLTGGDPAGWGYDGPFLASAEVYDPKNGTFAPARPMAETLTNHTATPLTDGRVLIAGGYDGMHDVATAEAFDSTNGAFNLLP